MDSSSSISILIMVAYALFILAIIAGEVVAVVMAVNHGKKIKEMGPYFLNPSGNANHVPNVPNAPNSYSAPVIPQAIVAEPIVTPTIVTEPIATQPVPTLSTTDESLRCTCGSIIQPGMTFCSVCGARVIN